MNILHDRSDQWSSIRELLGNLDTGHQRGVHSRTDRSINLYEHTQRCMIESIQATESRNQWNTQTESSVARLLSSK